jgi:hypothetical protein
VLEQLAVHLVAHRCDVPALFCAEQVTCAA